MNVLSLFAGIGGLDLGLEARGCTTTHYSEIDPYASSVMSARFPHAISLGDITAIDWSSVHDIDIICGGFPCQDISLAGKGAGIADGTRSGLWSYYADAIRTLRPRGVLVENVAQLSRNGLDIVLGDLADCGYDAEWQVLRADGAGFPHSRRRLFIVAYPGGEREQVPVERKQPAVEVAGRARSEGRTAGAPRFHWTDQPRVGRGPDGLPDWVDGSTVLRPASTDKHKRWDRIKCLGNAVVPACAERAAGRLMERIR